MFHGDPNCPPLPSSGKSLYGSADIDNSFVLQIFYDPQESGDIKNCKYLNVIGIQACQRLETFPMYVQEEQEEDFQAFELLSDCHPILRKSIRMLLPNLSPEIEILLVPVSDLPADLLSVFQVNMRDLMRSYPVKNDDVCPLKRYKMTPQPFIPC